MLFSIITCPPLTISNDKTHILTNMETKAMTVPARFEFKLTSANCLNDDGTSEQEDSY
jgi:hypothetical protein